jgi:hypothetical protein
LQITVFSGLRQNNMAYPFPLGFLLQKLIAERQSSDSGNRLAAIVSIVGISLPLQFNKFVAASQFLLSVNSGRPIANKNQRTGFQQGIL